MMINKIQKLINENPDLKIQSKNLLNMEGSIFKWAIENRELIDENGKATKYLHPYSWHRGFQCLPMNKWIKVWKEIPRMK